MISENFLESLRANVAAYRPPPRSGYVPVQVEFELDTPLMMGYPWIFGDALLARQLLQDILGDRFYDLPAKIPVIPPGIVHLPLKKTGMIYHASASILDTDEKHTTTIYKRFHEAPDLKSTTRIRTNSGPFRSHMLTLPYSASRMVKFNYFGDLGEIKRLLSPIRGLGKKRGQGGGEVARVRFRELSRDESIIRDGVAMRSIPAKMLDSFEDIRVILMAYTFPSWDPENVTLCVAPGGKCDFKEVRT